jgi:hypothetical protein
MGLPMMVKSAKKYQTGPLEGATNGVILTLLLDPIVTNQPNIKMKQRYHGRNARYAT